MATEVIDRQAVDAAQRELLTRRLTRAESERRKLLYAFELAAGRFRRSRVISKSPGGDEQGQIHAR